MTAIPVQALRRLLRFKSRFRERLSDYLVPPLGRGDAIVDPRQVTPTWLTQVLRDAGVLHAQRVSRIERHPLSASLTALTTQLRVEYSGVVGEDAPRRLLLKCLTPPSHADGFKQERFAEVGQREVGFYRLIAKQMTTLGTVPLVRCFDAGVAQAVGRTHLLLDDLSESHAVPPWPLPPTRTQREQAVETLARFHARWWEHPELGHSIGKMLEPEEIDAVVQDITTKYQEFARFLSDRLSLEGRELYDRLFATLRSSLIERSAQRRAITLVHGDGHWWNFLYPRDDSTARVYMIDWQSWQVGIGTDDLASLVGLNLDTDQRRAEQLALLKRYHATLLAGGVTGYSWRDCCNDYRESANRALAHPVGLWASGFTPGIWWLRLNRIVRTCIDLDQDSSSPADSSGAVDCTVDGI